MEDISDLPYYLPFGFRYSRFVKFRADQNATGHPDPLVLKVKVPPGGSTAGEGTGGVQSRTEHQSTPGKPLFILSS